MSFEDRWYEIEELGAGGQGKVYRVLDLDKIRTEDVHPKSVFSAVSEWIGNLSAAIMPHEDRFNLFKKATLTILRMEDPINHGALKVLHEPEVARDPVRAEARMKREIEAMSEVSHPNLLKILDYDENAKWYVSEFHPKGTLIDNRGLFTGNLVAAVRAFRPLVEGVANLHEHGEGFVHRDIKPHNVFLGSDGKLILGDFGLAFSMYEEETRLSDIWENVGSRDWMPGWAHAVRVEEIRPTFDVFSLGKLLWAMVSKIPVLQLWYFDRPNFNLARMFPDDPQIELANSLFEKCIVEEEGDCLPDAGALIEEVDKLLSQIETQADPINLYAGRKCIVCGIGSYSVFLKGQHPGDSQNFGFSPVGHNRHRVLSCTNCGHVQIFFDEKYKGGRSEIWPK